MAVKILLPDCSLRKSFDVYNCLKSRGYEVILADEKPSVSHKLIYTQQIYTLRKDCFAHFVEDLEFIRKDFNENTIVFIPTEEDTTILFLEYIEEYQKKQFFFALPDRPTFELARNKRNISRFCTVNNIPCPQEYSLDEIRKGFTKIIAKPSVGSGGLGHFYVSSQSDLCMLDDVGDDYILQEQLPNSRNVEGGFFLFDRGKFVGYYGHKRIRTYPVKAGVTVYSKISFNEEIKRAGIKLFEKLNWHGFAMVEFLFNPRTGHYEVIEVNPRLWGSFLLSQFANTGFLENYIRLSLGLHPKPYVPRKDVAIRWLFPFDLLNLISMNAKMESFWNFDSKNTCYIGFTYSPLRRSLMFLFLSLFDFQKVKKFFAKAMS